MGWFVTGSSCPAVLLLQAFCMGLLGWAMDLEEFRNTTLLANVRAGRGAAQVHHQPPILLVVIKTDGNEHKNLIFTFVSIFFSRNGSEFEKYGFKNRIEICGHTKTDKYGWRTEKLN
jgi:hypothetical protein